MIVPGTTQSAKPDEFLYELPGLIADHSLHGCIGSGSYGKVFLARNDLTGAYRALKVVFRDAFRDARPYQREFEAICRFEPISRSHPGFVQILQVGKLENAFYYIMELADDVRGAHTFDPETYKPRTLALKRTPEFNAMVEDVWGLIAGAEHGEADDEKPAQAHA